MNDVEADLRLLFEINHIELSGKKLIDIGGRDGNITIPLARLAYKMVAIEVHVVDPELDISEGRLTTERITAHYCRVEAVLAEQKGTFDFATAFSYQNSVAGDNAYPQGMANILKPKGKLLLAGKFRRSSSEEVTPFFVDSSPANLQDLAENYLKTMNPHIYILSSPIYSEVQNLALLHRGQIPKSPEV